MHRRAGDALEVDASVFEEPVVLDRDRRVLHLLGDLVEGNLDAVLPVEVSDLRAVGGEHRRLLAEVALLERGRRALKISTALFALAVATPTPGMASPAATIPATALTATNWRKAAILVGSGFDSGDTMKPSLTNRS